jgi:urease accessory protein
VSAEPARALERYDGALRFAVAQGGVRERHVTPPMRLFTPYAEGGEPRTIVLANIAGGVVGGDRLTATLDVGAGEDLLATTQAAEKVYRSDGADAVLTNRFTVAGTCEMLSQGTILFDGARLQRTTEIDVAEGGRFVYAETVIFGRLARGEVFRTGRLRDRIRVSRAGRLVWADDFALDGPIPAHMEAVAGLGGARALSTVVIAGDGAERIVDVARSLDPPEDVRLGASALAPNLVVARILARDPARGRAALGSLWTATRATWLGRPGRMPVIWSV